MRAAYLGPAGTYTEEALRASAPPGVDAVPYPTVYETVMAVQAGAAERAIVPIENSLEGGVAATLDALATDADQVRIAGELIHPIHHCVVARDALELDSVTLVVSHPQATAQCARFLRERLPRAERIAAPSTADAVMRVRDADASWVALGSRLSAELYDCEVIVADVEDHPDNETRFVWLAPAGEAPARAAREKTSIVFWGAGDERPGWLLGALREFADRRVNLTRIESRPRRGRLGAYMFFVDLEGAEDDAGVRDALTALRATGDQVRVLGSYPAA